MGGAEDQRGVEASSPSGSGWLIVGLRRGVALAALYGLLCIALAWIAGRVTGSEWDLVALGLLFAVFGLPVGALAGILLAVLCAAVDSRTERRLTRRDVAVRVIATVAAATALLAIAALDHWAVFVGGPCLLGLVSLWVWPLPDRLPLTTTGVDPDEV